MMQVRVEAYCIILTLNVSRKTFTFMYTHAKFERFSENVVSVQSNGKFLCNSPVFIMLLAVSLPIRVWSCTLDNCRM